MICPQTGTSEPLQAAPDAVFVTMDPIKLDATRKWVLDAAEATAVPAARPDDAGASGSGDDPELDAVITVYSEPAANRAFSWRKFLLHCG